jgi:hypothetical protein
MFYLMLGISKLGSVAWWNGDAMWFVIAQTETRLVDLTFLRSSPLLVYGWSHFVVLFELLFGLLCWVRLARPLLTVISVPHWILLGLVTGQWQFALLMIAAGGVFKAWEPLQPPQPETQAASPQPITKDQTVSGVPV